MFNCAWQRTLRCWFSKQTPPAETIFALASGTARSPISIIRVGGEQAYRTFMLTLKRSIPATEMSKAELLKSASIKHRVAHLRSIYTHSHELLDKSIVIFYPSESSYNGEDIVELQVHGSRAIIKNIFEELKRLGFRMAERGQFTKRAILNNKMDCLQAEGIHQLIMSDSDFSRRIALNHLLGDTSKQLEAIKTQLVSCLAASEAFIDFPGEEEDIKEELMDKTRLRVIKIIDQLRKCLLNRKQVQLMTQGIQVTIVGRPNAGKSTIINKLVKKEVAIVSDIPGTTRDLINASVEHKGIVVHLTDTAGLRETEEVIEREGIKRAVARSKEGHMSLFVVDATAQVIEQQSITLNSTSARDQEILSDPRTLLVVNKCDTVNLTSPVRIRTKYGLERQCELLVSALQQEDLDQLLDKIIDEANHRYKFEEFQSEMMLTKERHYKALEETLEHLKGYINVKLPVDARCEELREAITEFGSITGRVDTQQVLDVLFRDFCIGK